MKIKICGITNLPDARCVIDNAADMMGFIFYKKSPRYISPESVKKIVKNIPKGFNTVGVFVNESNKAMIDIAEFCGLKTLQLHGHEPLNQVSQICGFGIINALPMKEAKDLELISNFNDYTILVDTYGKDFGGSGRTIDWDLAKRAAKIGNVILAGGLTPGNIVTAVQTVEPYGVDVSSGVEKSKGIKDHDKIKTFIENLRNL